MAAPTPELTKGWTIQNQTTTPVDNGRFVTNGIATSVVDETTKPTATHNRSSQMPTK